MFYPLLLLLLYDIHFFINIFYSTKNIRRIQISRKGIESFTRYSACPNRRINATYPWPFKKVCLTVNHLTICNYVFLYLISKI